MNFNVIELSDLQIFLYYQFIDLIEHKTEVVTVVFSIESKEHLNVLFQVNSLLKTTMSIEGSKATVGINSQTLTRLIMLCDTHPELIEAL